MGCLHSKKWISGYASFKQETQRYENIGFMRKIFEGMFFKNSHIFITTGFATSLQLCWMLPDTLVIPTLHMSQGQYVVLGLIVRMSKHDFETAKEAHFELRKTYTTKAIFSPAAKILERATADLQCKQLNIRP